MFEAYGFVSFLAMLVGGWLGAWLGAMYFTYHWKDKAEYENTR